MVERKYREVGERIKDLIRAKGKRERRRVTYDELADAIDVHVGTVTAWANGYQRPEGGNLIRLAKALDANPDEIAEGSESTPPRSAVQLAQIMAAEKLERVAAELREEAISGPEEEWEALARAAEDLVRRVRGRTYNDV